uniref:Uncharacterized protein n=1 Tax=uncultured marine virus TaxID=186617 RepID=A0A0F7L3I9_9VIRU|nr:hypothetical protein [uncultured marine virus]
MAYPLAFSTSVSVIKTRLTMSPDILVSSGIISLFVPSISSCILISPFERTLRQFIGTMALQLIMYSL